MDMRYLAYCFADQDFYDEGLVGEDRAADVPLLPGPVPADVVMSTRGQWRLYRSPATVPTTGWKVHVSCTPDRAEEVVQAAVSSCWRRSISCKHLRTRRLVLTTQGKYADPTAAGKVVTAYPANEAELSSLLEELRTVLAGEPGARIASDIPMMGAPVSVRYGAYLAGWLLDASGRARAACQDENGQLVADDRSPRGLATPVSVGTAPAAVATLIAAAKSHDARSMLEITDVRVLHRSNGGGVYAATWPNGRAVVLKEARHHTGFDRDEADAVTRLRHEHLALLRLSGTGVTPEPISYLTAGDSDFLVMEHVSGPCVASRMATGHPGAVPGADPAAYRSWMEDVVERTRSALSTIHAHGVVHRDVHPGNLIEHDGRVVLIDLESCAVDGVAVSRGIATPLSDPGEDCSATADLAALERMRHFLLNPQYAVIPRRPDLHLELIRAGEHDVSDAGAVPEEGAGDDPQSTGQRLVAGLAMAASAGREDRLFPGDIAACASPGAALGLMHGAAGVLRVLDVVGAPVEPTWREWMARHSWQVSYLPPGLADGAEGLALCLAQSGDAAAAARVLDTGGTQVSPAPWWGHGTAGQALALAELGMLWEREELVQRALDLAAQAAAAVHDTGPRPPAGYRAGLLRGWAGVCLALLRVAEIAEAAGVDHAVVGRLRAAAGTAVAREQEATRQSATAIMGTDGGRLMPYLGTGSAALGLAADSLRRCVTEGSDPGGVRDVEMDRLVSGVTAALRISSVACAGLMNGRTGLALSLARLSPDDALVESHRRRLAWYAVPPVDAARTGHRLADSAVFLLGDQNMRSSADLATGAAGALLALCPSTSDAVAAAFGAALCLPRASRDDCCTTGPMTGVTTDL